MKYEMPFMDDVAMDPGLLDQRCFYQAFAEFDHQSIEKRLASDNLLIRIFALPDRQVGKRRLEKMGLAMNHEPTVIQMFYTIRVEAEGIGGLGCKLHQHRENPGGINMPAWE